MQASAKTPRAEIRKLGQDRRAQAIRLPDARMQEDVHRGERDELVAGASEGGRRRLTRARSGEGERCRRAAPGGHGRRRRDVGEEMGMRVDAARQDDAVSRVHDLADSGAGRCDGRDLPVLDDDLGAPGPPGRDDEPAGERECPSHPG